MAALVCELCGGRLIGNANGLFQCDSCGMEYSKEWAKSKIQEIQGTVQIEGTVDVTGSTIKVDNAAYVEKYLQNARRAKEKEDWEETEKYYNLVEQNEPSNIEAIFYSAYGKAKTALLDQDVFKREQAFKVLQNCVSIVDDNYEVENDEIEFPVLLQISADIIKMCSGSFVYTQTKRGTNILTQALLSTDNRGKTYSMFNRLQFEFVTTIENIISKYEDPENDKVVKMYEIATLHLVTISGRGIALDEQKAKARIEGYKEKYKKLNSAVKEANKTKYWEEHKEEKEQLEDEKAKIKGKINELNQRIETAKNRADHDELLAKVSALEKEQSGLGAFKSKEKKAIQVQIEDIKEQLRVIDNEIKEEVATIKAEIDMRKTRMSEIDDELTKER